MLRNRTTVLFMQKLSRSFSYTRVLETRVESGKDHSVITGTAKPTLLLEEKMKAMQQHPPQLIEDERISIYRVPARLREVEPKAYDPLFMSIGPYHYASPNLQSSEKHKLLSLNQLVSSGERSGNGYGKLIAELRQIEHQARGYYAEDIKLSKDEFVTMMLLDGSFIVQLLRDFHKEGFARSSLLSKRWMLPVVRRDLITLENQLPMIVLKTLFDKTRSETTQELSLEELALRFFDPLMPRQPQILKQGIESTAEKSSGGDQCHFKHLLDLFQYSISPGKVKRTREPHMYRSVSELKDAGIKTLVLGDSQPLDMRFQRGTLRIPRLQIDNHTGSFFRNMVAYEQCHLYCKSDVTAYIFFLAKLINTVDDVGLLHYEQVIQHSLGSNQQVADLVNGLCLEVEHDGRDSYLCDLVGEINSYCDKRWVKVKARLKQAYFSNIWVTISTVGGIVLLYLTLVQTTCDVINAKLNLEQKEVGWWGALNLSLAHPVRSLKNFSNYVSSKFSDLADHSHQLGDIVGFPSWLEGDSVYPFTRLGKLVGSKSSSRPIDVTPKNLPSADP